ncbi:unnamed protein product [Adineta ricciae]|uniref:Uncharacterized protein n=1 Tax=Adineta ricciae TaxID=249248 RepID=A0A814VGX2_ADIRI|nr:unnamed protein product [Adineta ricciae]
MYSFGDYNFNDPLPSPSTEAINQLLTSPSSTPTPPGVRTSNGSNSNSPLQDPSSTDIIPFLESEFFLNDEDFLQNYLGDTYPQPDSLDTVLSYNSQEMPPSDNNTPPNQPDGADDDKLRIIAQPKSRYRERYHCETDSNRNRAHRFIRTGNKNGFEYPTVQFSRKWCDPTRELYIQVTPVTVKTDTRQYHCIHPYRIDADEIGLIKDYEEKNNSLYFRIHPEEFANCQKRFLISRTKMIQSDLKEYGMLRIYGTDQLDNQQVIYSQKPKQTITAYQLWDCQLMFVIAERFNQNSLPHPIMETAVLSDTMTDVETGDRQSTTNHIQQTLLTQIKCIPQKVDWRGNEEIVIILPQQPNRQKNYTITFDFTPHPLVVINNVTHVDKRVFSFMAPQCPLPFTDQPRTFPMTIRENNVVIALVNFTYVPPISMTVNLCPVCSQTTFANQGNTASNKRQRGREEFDSVEIVNDLTLQIAAMGIERENSEASSSSSSSSSSSESMRSAATTTTATGTTAATAAARDNHAAKLDRYLDQLQEALVQFVQTNDPSRLFRRTRVLLSKCEDSPPPLHVAIERGHISLALTIIEQVANYIQLILRMSQFNNQSNADTLYDALLNSPTLLPNLENLTEDLNLNVNNEFLLDININSITSELDNLTSALTPSGFSPDNNSNIQQQEVTNPVYQAVALPSDMQTFPDQIEIIAQPYYGTKLRYRSDYNKNDQRQGVLKNRTKNSSYIGPAIRIPQQYLDPNGEYYVRVCLVTVINDKTNIRYIHPYRLENTTDNQLYDQQTNSIFFPLQEEDYRTGTKSFPTIRIVKEREGELKNYGCLRVFDDNGLYLQNDTGSNACTTAKQLKKEYSLDQSQLAFTIVQKTVDSGVTYMIPCPQTTAFSEPMIEGESGTGEPENDSQSVDEQSTTSPEPSCRVYKYAPRYTVNTNSEDMIIILTSKKLEVRKYGQLKVVFECNSLNPPWSHVIDDLTITDRIVSFKTPEFPYQFDQAVQVNVILRQSSRDVGTLTYFYLPTSTQCSNCHLHTMNSQSNSIPNVPSKRMASQVFDHGAYESDIVVSTADNSQKLSESSAKPTPESSSSKQTAGKNKDSSDEIIKALFTSFETLFLENDYTSLLRIGRSFIRKNPQIMHEAISRNHSDVLSKFIPVASIEILQLKNESLGENTLLHALRLNRIEIVKILLHKTGADVLMKETDNMQNNIFHIMACYTTSVEILDLMIDYLLEKSFPIQETFDHRNHESRTPLQLSVVKNNLLITKKILQYFDTSIHEVQNHIGDNLLHLAVRHGDLDMVEYLIEDGKLDQLLNHSNLAMTPIELAQSLHRDDITAYLRQICPLQQIFADSGSSSDDEDD